MGRVCPAPCEDGCNRNEVEGHVGINSVEHYIGDYALEHGLKLPAPGASTGKKVAIIGGGPAGLACAYFVRRSGHACTIFEAKSELGGMMRYGIPGYRTPRDVLDGEIRQILDMGVEVRTGVKIGVDVTLDQLQMDFDAVFLGTGAQSGTPLTVPGAEASNNCISGIAFLAAFNEGRLQHGAQRVLVIGGGDTAMDVAAVARRLGHIENVHEKDHPEFVVLGQTTHDVAISAKRRARRSPSSTVGQWMKCRRRRWKHEHVTQEGVNPALPYPHRSRPRQARPRKGASTRCRGGLDERQDDDQARHRARYQCDLIVSAIGQAADFTGFEALDNGKGAAAVDAYQRSPKREGVFAGGDVIRPHLLTTAIGHAWIAAQSIDHSLAGEAQPGLPKVNVHHFDLIQKLKETGHTPADYDHTQARGTDHAAYALHNFEDRAKTLIVNSKELFLGHFREAPGTFAKREDDRRRKCARRLRVAPSTAERERGPRRGRPLHELRALLRMRQLPDFLPAEGRFPGEEERSHHWTLRRYRLRQVHRLPYLQRRLPVGLYSNGP